MYKNRVELAAGAGWSFLTGGVSQFTVSILYIAYHHNKDKQDLGKKFADLNHADPAVRLQALHELLTTRIDPAIFADIPAEVLSKLNIKNVADL